MDGRIYYRPTLGVSTANRKLAGRRMDERARARARELDNKASRRATVTLPVIRLFSKPPPIESPSRQLNPFRRGVSYNRIPRAGYATGEQSLCNQCKRGIRGCDPGKNEKKNRLDFTE